jgi:hypothetical protein
MALESIPGYSGFRGGQVGQAYNEAAFRHFLALDRRRAERSTRSLLLVFVTVRQSPASKVKLTDATAAVLFSELGACVREVDFVGWYREGRVVAAVLTQGVNTPGEMRHRITERLVQALSKRLSTDQARNLRVRVVRLSGGVRV